MASEFLAARELVRGVASRPDHVFIISKGKKLIADDVAHTIVIARGFERWGGAVTAAWDSTAIATAQLPTPGLVVVGEDGEVVVYRGAGKSEREALKPDPVMIRNARGIGGYVYACGGKRQVYKRIDDDRWLDVSAPTSLPGEGMRGFEAIDGYSEDEIYAVGWAGEIWQFDGATWVDRGSQTDAILCSVCCAPDGLVYAGGQLGTLIRGRGDAWEPVVWQDDVGVDIWDLCWFQDKLYVATMEALFTVDGNTLDLVDFGEAGRLTCYSLTTAGGVLWSVGHQHVASFDGHVWRRYE